VLAELVDRVTGRDFREVFADRVAGPMGLPRLQLGVPAGEQDGVLDVVLVGDAATAAEGLADRVAETNADNLLRFNEPEVRAAGVPGAGGIASAGDVAMFYQGLLHDDAGVFDAAVLADATGHVRNTLNDPLYNVPANRTLGLVVAGDDGQAVVRQFGRSTSPRAFGASGVGGQMAWADPETGLSFCYLTNGLDEDVVASFTRSAKLCGLAARCARPAAAD
jgi:CubicO group peptidase (beta-lactamase class C family)